MPKFNEMLDGVEVLGKPIRKNGRLSCEVRCRIPVQLSVGTSGALSVRNEKTEKSVEIDENRAKENEEIVVGIASSTSVDWHGTEMSLLALQDMVRQFKRGVSHVPSHNDDEWDQMIGRTVDGEIEQRTVVNPHPGLRELNEDEYVLRVTSAVYTNTDKGKMLVERLSRGDTIGWSIGGWFTDMRVIYDEADEEIERIIIDAVDLDHLAVTRKPSNPDSFLEGVGMVRSKANEIVRAQNEAHRLKPDMKLYDEEEEVEDAQDEIDESSGEEEAVADEKIDEEAESQGELDEEQNRKPYMKLDEEDQEEQEDHDEGAIKDDEDQIEDLEDDKKDEEEDLKDEEEEREILPFADLSIDYEMSWNWDTDARDEILGEGMDDWERYAKAHIYYDTNMAKDTKEAYKLPIARMVNDELVAIWQGIVSAMAAVNGARGGVDISEDERKKAYDHLKQYYEKAQQDVPEMRAAPVYEAPPGPHTHNPTGDGGFEPLEGDQFKSEGEAKLRGEALGCGLYAHEHDGGVFMPCRSHDEYEKALYAESAKDEGDGLTDTKEEGEVLLSKGSKNFEGTVSGADNNRAEKAHSTGDSLMSNEVERVDGASEAPEKAVVTALTEKVDALTRSVEAIVGQMQAQTPTQEEATTEPEAEPDRMDAIARSLEALASTMQKREVEAVEAKVQEDDAEKIALRERLASMETKIARMAAKPQRRVGRRFTDEVRTKDHHPDQKVLDAIESDGQGSAVAAVARDFEDVFYYNKRVHGAEKLPDRNDLKDALRAVFMAGSIDGYIKNPDFN